MATKTLITEAEFLRMTFDGPEPDYLDGELVERAMPNTQHSDVQSVFCGLIFPLRAGNRLFALPELRLLTQAGHYRVVDIAVYQDRKPVGLMPVETPFIVVEIVSPGDPHEELMTKLAEYSALGVPHVWIAEPGLQSLSVYERGSLLRVEAFALPEFGLRFTAAQLFAA